MRAVRHVPGMKRALVVAVLAVVAACGKNHLMAEVDGAVVPEADDTIAAEAGPNVTILPDAHEELYKLPAGPVVRIAADRGVSWRRVKDMKERLARQGSRAVLLVGRGLTDEVRAFEPIQELRPGPHLVLDAGKDGGFFVGPGDGGNGTRVQAFDHQHIAKSFIREAMGPMVAKTKLHDVEIRVDPHMNWVDVVRAIDGARTCCPGVDMRASLVE
jgi:hypothetical protein